MKMPTPRTLAASLLLAALAMTSSAIAEDQPQLFKKISLTDQFYSEGAAIGDFN